MKKSIIIVLFSILSFNSFSQSNSEIQWRKIQIPYNYLLSLDLEKRSECKEEVDILIKETMKKNPNKNLDELWADNYLTIPRCVENELDLYIAKRKKKTNTKDNSPIIKEWINMTVKRNFILSKYLDDNHCSLIWEKQIPLFKEKNPTIKNANVIDVGEKITVQRCKKMGELETKEEVKVVKEEYKKYYWMLYLVAYKKNEKDPLYGGGINLNLNLLNIIEYRMDLMHLDHLFLFNKFLISLLKYEKEELFIGNALVNNFDYKSYNYYFLSYRRKFDNHFQVTVDVGSNFKSGTNYLRTELFYRRFGAFYQYFEEENILEDSNKKQNRYNLLGVGFRF